MNWESGIDFIKGNQSIRKEGGSWVLSEVPAESPSLHHPQALGVGLSSQLADKDRTPKRLNLLPSSLGL